MQTGLHTLPAEGCRCSSTAASLSLGAKCHIHLCFRAQCMAQRMQQATSTTWLNSLLAKISNRRAQARPHLVDTLLVALQCGKHGILWPEPAVPQLHQSVPATAGQEGVAGVPVHRSHIATMAIGTCRKFTELSHVEQSIKLWLNNL